MNRRIGKFRIPREHIDDNFGKLIYSELVPIRVEHDFGTDNLEVTALSDFFDEVKRGEYPSEYIYRIESDWVETDITGVPTAGRELNHRIVWEKKE